MGYLAAGLVAGVLGVSTLIVVGKRWSTPGRSRRRLSLYVLAGLALTFAGVQLVAAWSAA